MSVVPITVEMARRTIDSGRGSPSISEVNECFSPDGRMSNKIRLIKFIRTFTDMGLKDSKDTIESVPQRIFEVKKLLAPIFEAYHLSIFTPEEIERNPEINVFVNKDTSAIGVVILKGMATALETWKAMGFRSPFEACRIVLDNLERKAPTELENLGM